MSLSARGGRGAATWLPLLVVALGLQACGGGGGGDQAPSNPPVTGPPSPPAPPPVAAPSASRYSSPQSYTVGLDTSSGGTRACSLLANSFGSVNKIYLVYYVGDGDGCGRGAWPPTLHRTVLAVVKT